MSLSVALPGLDLAGLYALLDATAVGAPPDSGPAPYLRPLLAPLLGPLSPNADAMVGVLDTAYGAAAAAIAQARIDHDPRVATGVALVNMAAWGGVEPLPGDTDEDLRRRVRAGPSPAPTSKAGIAIQVGALVNVPVVVQTTAPGQFSVTLFGNSPRADQVLPLVRRLKAAGMRPSGQMLVPRPATSRLGRVRLGAGTVGGAVTVIALPDGTAPVAGNSPVIDTPQIAYRTARPMGHARLGLAALGTVTLGH